MTDLYRPLRSLREGNWFKLICGASFQHLPAVRNLTLAYTLAGADCVDVAADPAVIAAAREAMRAARCVATGGSEALKFDGLPWLMVSLNDGEDPHFRKAEFDVEACPAYCTRPCESICPAGAIAFSPNPNTFSGVIDDFCYGCGRCLTVCPIQQISTRSYVFTPAAIAPLVLAGVDAVEIHTQVGRLADFKRLWGAIAPSLDQLKLVAISCPDGENLIEYLWDLYKLISPLPCPLVWQTDGRPMSGDIGDGATRATVKLGQKVLAARLPGYVQLAGGTNSHTVSKLIKQGLLGERAALSSQYNVAVNSSTDRLDVCTEEASVQTASAPRFNEDTAQLPYRVAGIAYGSYARTLLAPVLDQLAQRNIQDSSVSINLSENFPNGFHSPDTMTLGIPQPISTHLECYPDLLEQAVSLADSLVSQIKSPMKLAQTIPRQPG
ncbi:MAG: 4Fe-4S ferredoxin [Leptolyngbyaceae cyanobacterium SL_5_14]|nr:4Fe-4S ferredoxin [Leptolyngbyaceae cyanobacterium SL_5_14]